MQTNYVLVTPEMASQMLERNRQNRNLSAYRVDQLARAIKNGEWKVTHQGIAVTSDGDLIDGQHRLAAIMLADTPVMLAVTTGIDRDVFPILDTNRRRTAADTLHVAGIQNSILAASTARLVNSYDSRASRPWDSVRRACTSQVILDKVSGDEERYMEAVRLGTNVSRRLVGSATSYSAGAYIVLRWVNDAGLPDATAITWLTDLATGANQPSGDPRLALASWASSTGRAMPDSTRAEILMMATAKMFHQSMSGASIQRMQVSSPLTWTFHLPG